MAAAVVTPFAGQRHSVTAVVRDPAAERDDYGNLVYTDREVDVPDCLIAPVSSSEDTDNAQRVTDTATIYDLSGTWPDGAVNRVRFNGATWEVRGDPARWPGPIGGAVIEVQKVEG